MPGPRNAARSLAHAETRLERVGRDRTTGAHGLAVRALRALSELVAPDRPATAGPGRSELRRIAKVLARIQPAMGIFRQWSREWTDFARRADERDLGRELRGWIDRWGQQLRDEPDRLTAVAHRFLPPGARVLTLSRSSSVRAALSGLPRSRRPREVLVLESLPGGEGRLLARELRTAGVRARLVPDAEGTELVRGVDLVLLGADAVYADGSLVHKVGTRRIAVSARAAGVPVVVLSGRSKWVNARTAPSRLVGPFDRTPPEAIGEYWTDRGKRRVPRGRRNQAGRDRRRYEEGRLVTRTDGTAPGRNGRPR